MEREREHQESADPPTRAGGPFSPRVILVAVLCTVLTVLWVRSVGLINFLAYLADPVPSFPGLFFLSSGLLISLAGRRALRARSRSVRALGRALALSRGELLVLYAFLALSCVWPAVGMVRFVFPSLTAMQYCEFDSPEFAEYGRAVPAWLAPRDPEVIRELWEGSDRLAVVPERGSVPFFSDLVHSVVNLGYASARVPWDAWLAPILVIGLLMVAMSVSFVCLASMFRGRWEEEERVTFPLVRIPLLMTESSARNRPAFFADPVMWIGLAVAVAFNLLHVISSVHPSLPRIERSYHIGSLLTERPWSVMSGVRLWFAPELVGIGYLVPSDILLTTAVTYLGLQYSMVAAEAMGRNVAGYPFERIQGNGAYIAMASVTVWMARRHLGTVLRRAIKGDPAMPGDPMSSRMMVAGAVLGFAVVCGIAMAAGMPFWLALLYMGCIWAFALVLTRARAEGGAPVVYMWPYEQVRRTITTVLPPALLAPGGSRAPLAATNALFFLSAGQFGGIMATQLEDVRLAGEGGFSRRRMVRMAIGAVAIGYLAAMWMHLATYYEYGANVLEGGTTLGGYRTSATLIEFRDATAVVSAGYNPATLARERAATLVGFVTVLLMTAGRLTLLRLPLHPIGYVIGLIRGQFCWWPFLLTWTVRSVVLRIGGVGLYNRILPAFVGLALGHFLANGIIIGLAGIWLGDVFMGQVQHVRSH